MLWKLLFSLLCLVLLPINGETILGFWKTISDIEPHQAESIIALYEYHGKYYGRLIGGFDEKGELSDTIYNPKKRAYKLQGNPYFAGLDVIWDLKKKEDKYVGEGVDPRTGFFYETEIWNEGSDLDVEGKIFFISREQRWVRPDPSDFPPGFKKPDFSTFVPKIPHAKSVKELEEDEVSPSNSN